MRKYIPNFLKYPLIFLYVLGRSILRGNRSPSISLNLADTLPPHGSEEIIHGGKVKLLHLREKWGDRWKSFNIAYFASSGLPFAPSIWIKIFKFFGIKIVWNQNGVAYPAWAGKEASHINKLMKPIHQADHVIFQSKFTKRCSDKFLGEYRGPHTILINPVDTREFYPNTTIHPTAPLVVLMSGHHFESAERLKLSLRSMEELIARGINIKLLVIGNTQELPHKNWIEVVGRFPRSEAAKHFRRAHIMLHLKSLDPCPNFVLEALASGLPVVGLANGGMPELVSNDSGVLIPTPEDFERFHYPDFNEVANAIIKIADNLEQYSRNARSQALNFDKEIWLKRHEEIFNNLLDI